MKNLKKVALGLVVTLMAFGFSAFKTAEKTDKVRTGYFFRYTPASSGLEHLSSSWEHIPANSDLCPGSNNGCVIEVNVDPAYTQIIGLERVLSQNVPLVVSTNNPDDTSDMINNSFNKD